MAYTNVPAPTTPSYTNKNPGGLVTYDDLVINYDNSPTQYDGNNINYTNVGAPTTISYTNVAAPINP